MEGELLLSILSSLAESESHSIAENNKWSIQKRFQNGTFKIGYPPYGYDNVDGQMVVNEEQAKTVRWIFDAVLSGKSPGTVAKELNERGTVTKRGGRWTGHTINGMIKNEKYTGDLILQKTYTDDRFSRHVNRGEKNRYYVRDHHKPIVSHEDFEAANAIIEANGLEKGIRKDEDKYKNRYAMSGRIVCGECGGTWKRVKLNNHFGFACNTHVRDKNTCGMKSIPEEPVKAAFVTMMNKLTWGRSRILLPFAEMLKEDRQAEFLDRLNELEVLLEKNGERRQQIHQFFAKGLLDPAVYADDGISATNTAKREAFNRMIQDCRDGKIDLILTKSISRFSRNTVDCLKYTRELKGLNIAVFFEKENINTLDAKGEVLMTIMAALAQQESESLSANVRLGIQFRNQQGKVQVNHNRFLGYTKDEDGKLIIVPEEAGIVRRIYAEYMDGRSFLQIKRSLEADGILNGAGNAKWHESNIKQILTNEKYIGDALLQKTYTVNTLEKKRVANNGLAPKYYVEGSHEAIIDKDVFLRVQAEIVRRANILTDGKKRVYSSRYALSSIVFCGHCGDIFRRVKWNNRGCKSTVWRCVSRVLKKSSGIDCPAKTIREEELHAAVVTAINDAWSQKDNILPVLQENIREVLESDTEERLAAVDTAIREKQAELLDAGKDQGRIDEIGDAIISLQERRQDILTEAAKNTELKERVDDLASFLDEQTEALTEYSETLVRRLIEKITIYDKKLTVEFKSGFSIDVDA